MKALILVFAFLVSSIGFAEELQINGASSEEVAKIRGLVPEAFTGPIELNEIDEVIRELTKSNLYDRVAAEQTADGSIVIEVKPLRTITKVVIKGQNKFREAQLRTVIAIAKDERFDRKRIIEAGERLKQFYGEQGYFNAGIEVTFSKEATSGLTVTFQITEGQPCRIRGFTLESDNKDLVDRLERITNSYKNDPLTTEAIESLARRMNDFLKDHMFLRAELVGPEAKYNAQKTQSWLTYKISEPFRYEFTVEGYKSLQPTDIYRILSSSSLERGTADPAIEAVERVRQGYLKLGYANVEVTSRLTENKSTFVRRVRVDVVENSRVHIKELAITGRVSRPNSYYEKFIRNNSSSIVSRGYYNRQDLERGYANLVTELRNQGYLKVKIQSSRLEYLDTPGEARVVLVMDEGPLTQVRSIQFKGNSAFTSDTLSDALTAKANTALRLPLLEKALDELKEFYQERGYLEMKIMNESEDLIQYNDRGTHADIQFEIFEGPRVTVHSISIEGNQLTKNDVILKTIEIKPGDLLTPAKIEAAEDRLNRMGIFLRASVRTLEEGSNVSERTLVVAVVEDDPGQVKIGAGVNSERDLTVRGYLETRYSNLFGTARAISVRGEVKSHVIKVNYPQYEVVGSYREPFFLGTSAKGIVNLTHGVRIFEYKSKDNETRITRNNKIDTFIEKSINKHLLVTWKAWSLDARKEFERYGRCIKQEPFNPNVYCRGSDQQIATMGPLIDWDYRDKQIGASKGHRTTFSLDFSAPMFGSSTGINFIKTEATHTHITQVSGPKRLWVNTVRGGYLTNISHRTDSGVPTSQIFFLGGFSTIRGYTGDGPNERLPFDDGTKKFDTGNQIHIKKDMYYALVKSEFQFGLGGDFAMAFFYDGGIVDAAGLRYTRPYRDAVGFGFRYITPIGAAAAVDMGFKLGPNTDSGRKQDPYVIHFSISTF